MKIMISDHYRYAITNAPDCTDYYAIIETDLPKEDFRKMVREWKKETSDTGDLNSLVKYIQKQDHFAGFIMHDNFDMENCRFLS